MELLGNPEFWKYLSIPLVAGLVGFGTNWLAVQFTFSPIEFVGIRPWFGWQGIIPAKAEKMSGIVVDTAMSKLGSLPEIFDEMDPDVIAWHIIRYAEPRIEELVDEIAGRDNPGLWKHMPELVKRNIYARIRRDFPAQVQKLVREMGERIDELVDLKELVVLQVMQDRTLVNRIFQEAGEVEFRFIINSGLWFGMLFGVVQMIVWYFSQAWYILPAFGFLVGYATNWIALNIIFRPLYPVQVGPWKLQGIFIKRQPDVARIWGKLVAHDVLTIRNIMQTLIEGSGAPIAKELIEKHMRPLVDESLGIARPLVRAAVGARNFDNMRETTAEKALEMSQQPFADEAFNTDRAELIANMIRERMLELSEKEFQMILRPAFQEDEIKLILIGAGLGFLAGLGQFILVFGGFA